MTLLSAQHRAKVTAVLEGWEAAWNASDMHAMWRLATDAIHWLNVVGCTGAARRKCRKAHQAFFDQLFKGGTCKLEEIESIEAACRVARSSPWCAGRWAAIGGRNGVMRPPGRDRTSLVLVPRGEGLAIAHGANVPIDEEAEAHNPIKR